MEITVAVPKKTKLKLKIELSHDPAIPLLGMYPKESKSAYYCMPLAHHPRYSSTIHNSQGMESAWVSLSTDMNG
jgi:hypothetical protein